MSTNAGIILVTKFVRNKSNIFSEYINYIDRDSASRKNNVDKFVDDRLYQKPDNELSDYLEYVGNPEKMSNLFTASSDTLTKDEKQDLKNQFILAQKNGSIMWQTVFSFDNEWLEKNGIYDSSTHSLNEKAIQTYIRKSMNKMLTNEKLEFAVWSAGIHYNTDNIHVHIATVEPTPMRETISDGKYKGEFIGVWKAKTIGIGKSVLANEIIRDKGFNKQINELMRNNIIKDARETQFETNKNIAEDFLQLYYSLPEDKRLWKYGNNAMKQYRDQINKITDKYIQEFKPEEFENLKKYIKQQDDLYKETYGKNSNSSYYQYQINNFYYRMGNVVLRELKNYDYEMRATERVNSKNKLYQKTYQINKNRNNIKRSLRQLEYYLSDEYDNVKAEWQYQNELEYRQWIEEQELEN